jgi:hypothetical protein
MDTDSSAPAQAEDLVPDAAIAQLDLSIRPSLLAAPASALGNLEANEVAPSPVEELPAADNKKPELSRWKRIIGRISAGSEAVLGVGMAIGGAISDPTQLIEAVPLVGSSVKEMLEKDNEKGKQEAGTALVKEEPKVVQPCDTEIAVTQHLTKRSDVKEAVQEEASLIKPEEHPLMAREMETQQPQPETPDPLEYAAAAGKRKGIRGAVDRLRQFADKYPKISKAAKFAGSAALTILSGEVLADHVVEAVNLISEHALGGYAIGGASALAAYNLPKSLSRAMKHGSELIESHLSEFKSPELAEAVAETNAREGLDKRSQQIMSVLDKHPDMKDLKVEFIGRMKEALDSYISLANDEQISKDPDLEKQLASVAVKDICQIQMDTCDKIESRLVAKAASKGETVAVHMAEASDEEKTAPKI